MSMDEADLRLDGNHVAGLLAEVFQFDMTVEWTGWPAARTGSRCSTR